MSKLLGYFNGDELAATVWKNKYALKDSHGNIFEETPDDMHRRMASEIARIEKKYNGFMDEELVYNLLKDFKYIIPQGGPMSGIGNPFQKISLSNCFVIGNNSDSYGGIMETDEQQVQLMKRRGGVGHDLSHIRPKGSVVNNSALTSTGIVPFMERYSNSTREVAQDGRRGALMLSISITHPDSIDFINAKTDTKKVTGANISVRIDDSFMEAVVNGANYTQQYPIDSDSPDFIRLINAQKVWEQIVHNAWSSAEPGILFWDTIIGESIPDCYADKGFKTVSTNPCGEIPLCPYDSCRLLAINLYSYVDDPFTKQAQFNFKKFWTHVNYAQRIMDNIIDLEIEKIDIILAKIKDDPESETTKRTEILLWENIKDMCIKGRRTGVGVTAEGDMLAALGYRYGTDESIAFSEKVHKELALAAYSASVELARERGAFPVFDVEKEKDNPFINRLKEADPFLYNSMCEYGRRNIALLTIAPTGTTSLMTQTTSGLEPAFLISYKRRRKINPNDKDAKVAFVDEVGDSWEEYNVFHHKFKDWYYTSGIAHEPIEGFNDKQIEKLIKKSPYYKATANDIDWVQKVKLQGAVQKWIDHSISVTVNIPESATEELVGEIYKTAWEVGCKGVTVYRDGSRSGVLVTETKEENKKSKFEYKDAIKRPKELFGQLYSVTALGEQFNVAIGLMDELPYEVFAFKANGINPPSGDGIIRKVKRSTYAFVKDDEEFLLTDKPSSEQEAVTKLASGMLRHASDVRFVVDTLNSTDGDIMSFEKAIARTLKRYIKNGQKSTIKCWNPDCPGDGSNVMFEEGCTTCHDCGASKC